MRSMRYSLQIFLGPDENNCENLLGDFVFLNSFSGSNPFFAAVE